VQKRHGGCECGGCGGDDSGGAMLALLCPCGCLPPSEVAHPPSFRLHAECWSLCSVLHPVLSPKVKRNGHFDRTKGPHRIGNQVHTHWFGICLSVVWVTPIGPKRRLINDTARWMSELGRIAHGEGPVRAIDCMDQPLPGAVRFICVAWSIGNCGWGPGGLVWLKSSAYP
jgi:hypothetical protein